MIKYRTRFGEIQAIEIARETATMIVMPGASARKEAKRSDWSNWHDSWKDARNWILSEARLKVEHALGNLETARNRLAEAEAIPERDDVGDESHHHHLNGGCL